MTGEMRNEAETMSGGQKVCFHVNMFCLYHRIPQSSEVYVEVEPRGHD